MSRRRGREMAMQMLFQEEQSGSPPAEVEVLFWQSHRATAETRAMAQSIFNEAVSQRRWIDETIRKTVRRWKLERLATVDRSIIRMAIAEFLAGETPRAIVIDEAVEIAKKFGGERSPEFVNGILDQALADGERSKV